MRGTFAPSASRRGLIALRRRVPQAASALVLALVSAACAPELLRDPNLLVNSRNQVGPVTVTPKSFTLSRIDDLRGYPKGILKSPRSSHILIKLNDGRVLAAFGLNASTFPQDSETYDPDTEVWTTRGSVVVRRTSPAATLLNDGKVLVATGRDNTNACVTSAEIFNPTTNTWAATGAFTTGRRYSPLITLQDDRVLMIGGETCASTNGLTSVQVYTPTAGTWAAGTALPVGRSRHTATLLANGKVLVAGGNTVFGTPLATAVLYDPATNTWAATGNMTTARSGHFAIRLNSGKVLVTGGLPRKSMIRLPAHGARPVRLSPQPLSRFSVMGGS
jgi:hypothetical protein